MTDLWTMPSTTAAKEDPALYAARQAERDSWFKKIQPNVNWKFAVDAIIEADDFEQCNQACIWFTGSELTKVEMPGCTIPGIIRVTAPGYYATIGA